MKTVLTLLLLFFSVIAKAQGPAATNRYFELCVADTNFCAIGVLDTFRGEFRVVVKDAISPSEDPGVRIDVVSAQTYANMQKYSLLQNFKTKEELARTPEEEAILGEQTENVAKCLMLVAGCGLSIAEAFGTAGLGSALAVVACYATYYDCKAVRNANLALEARRKEVLAKVKQERELNPPPSNPAPTEIDPTVPRPGGRTGGGASPPVGGIVCKPGHTITSGTKHWVEKPTCTKL